MKCLIHIPQSAPWGDRPELKWARMWRRRQLFLPCLVHLILSTIPTDTSFPLHVSMHLSLTTTTSSYIFHIFVLILSSLFIIRFGNLWIDIFLYFLFILLRILFVHRSSYTFPFLFSSPFYTHFCFYLNILVYFLFLLSHGFLCCYPLTFTIYPVLGCLLSSTTSRSSSSFHPHPVDRFITSSALRFPDETFRFSDTI